MVSLSRPLGSCFTESICKLFGEIEADETFIGGKVGNMSKSKPKELKATGRNRGMQGKPIVTELLDREKREARVKVMPNVRAYHIRTNINENVVKGSTIYSDLLRVRIGVSAFGVYGNENEFIDHTIESVRGRFHTNGMENFWSLLKRALRGTYVSVEPFHLQAYCDEQAFRYNNRKGTDADRFTTVMRQVVDTLLTYKELIGQAEEAAQSFLRLFGSDRARKAFMIGCGCRRATSTRSVMANPKSKAVSWGP